ncbi:Nucleolar protein 5A [Fasciolopsis buskii]|uniref:Nucleolar protein 5A n=1 Tax=Fasciolopsis buskii TaxID=27845 RepID=A0A8E0RJM1_9TREM|nr:Nucleolar protein 5A [Fasciolopsis buski]
MGTTQHFALFEHVTGYALFRIREFDEITRNFTAHVNSFVKPVAFVHFRSVEEAIENVANVSEGVVSSLLKQFLNSNVPKKDCVLGVSHEEIGKSILSCGFGFDCVWHGGIREVLRVIRQHFSKLTKSLITQPGNAFSLAVNNRTPLSKTSVEEQIPGRVAEAKARLVVGLARARSQLNLSQHLADTAVMRALTLIDELDADLTHSVTRLRTCYFSHFPEICRSSSAAAYLPLTDDQLIHLIALCPTRVHLLSEQSDDKLRQVEVLLPILDRIKHLARDSIGADLSAEDASQLKLFAERLLRTKEVSLFFTAINLIYSPFVGKPTE